MLAGRKPKPVLRDEEIDELDGSEPETKASPVLLPAHALTADGSCSKQDQNQEAFQ